MSLLGEKNFEEILKFIDDEITGHLNGYKRNGLGLFLKYYQQNSRTEVKNQILDCINLLKIHVRFGLSVGMKLDKVIYDFMVTFGDIINRDVDGNKKMGTRIAILLDELPQRFAEKCLIQLK